MAFGNTKTALRALAIASLIALSAPAASPDPLFGAISGFVKDSAGTPQIGASVLLYNRYDRVIGRYLTDDQGEFQIAALVPDLYSVGVHLASFLPAMKRNIEVQPGMKSLLNVSLASVFSTIELVYNAPGTKSSMSEDWKMVLRTSLSTRPVLRIVPDIDWRASGKRPNQPEASAFSETQGLFRLSGGESSSSNLYASSPDLGTSFALATSLYGKNQLEFSGNFGYSTQSGAPTSGFRTTFSRAADGGMAPEVALTMRQMGVPLRAGNAFLLGESGAPAMRAVSLTFSDSSYVTDSLLMDYGFALESVSFLDRVNYLSPFARFTYEAGDLGQIQFAYFSGVPTPELITQRDSDASPLRDDMLALYMFPRVSLRDGNVELQRSKSHEIGFSKKLGSGRKFAVSGFHEEVTNTALTLVGANGLFDSNDLLPEIFTRGSVLNGGSFSGLGYAATLSQTVGDNFELALSFGSMSNLALSGHSTAAETEDLRANLRRKRQEFGAARVSALVPVAGTRFIATYRTVDPGAVSPGHYHLTQRLHQAPGLGVLVRQPVPRWRILPWRMELTADLRNLLAQGYIPVSTADGRRVYLMQTPKSVRGGLSFIF